MGAKEEFRFINRFRALPKNFGIYGGHKVLDFDEIVISTDTMPFEDYMRTRIYHFLVSLFWNNSWFDDAVNFARTLDIKASAWLDATLAAIERDDGEPNQLQQRFINETKNELFESKEACREYYMKPENWSSLEIGKFGTISCTSTGHRRHFLTGPG